MPSWSMRACSSDVFARAEKSLMLTGLRGVGKTVLLNEMERMAQAAGYRSILIEAHESKPLAALLVPDLRRLLYELDRIADVKNKVRRGLMVLKSFIGSIKMTVGDVEFGIDIPPEQGTADSGDLEIDLPHLFAAIADAAQEQGVAVAVLIDEIQYLASNELSALIMAMHRLQQRQLPMVLIGAGLPILPGLAGESKSYAERLFSFPDVGPLSEADAAKAIREPIEQAKERIEPAALEEIVTVTRLSRSQRGIRTFFRSGATRRGIWLRLRPSKWHTCGKPLSWPRNAWMRASSAFASTG
jgi:hypothetical protein